MTTLLTQADEAIQQYEQFKTNGDSVDQPDKYPHWDPVFKKINDVWKSKYEKQLVICSDRKVAQSIMHKFRSDVDKIFSRKIDYHNLKKYYTYLIDHQVNFIGTQLMEMLASDDQKENNEKIPIVLLKKLTIEQLEVKKVVYPSSVDKVTQELEKLNSSVPTVAFMLRAHSKLNNPNDNTSEVTDVAFELNGTRSSLEQVQKYTNVFATCGQYVINFIDADTGRIIKRFNDDHMNQKNKKEVYCKLAWTIINGKSVLVAGGKHGQVKVIMPNKNVCISRFDAHTAAINILLFHWKHHDILLSASDDSIKIWRIQIKDSDETIECECNYELINEIEYRPKNKKKKEKVLSMCFIPSDQLLISTELENYIVSLTDDEMFNLNAEMNPIDTNERDMSTYLTTHAQDTNKNPKLTAEVLRIFVKSEKEEIISESINTNGFFYINNKIMSPLVNENLVYKLDIGTDEESRIFLKVIGKVDLNAHVNYKNDLNTNLTLGLGSDGLPFIFQPATDGLFYQIRFNKDFTRHKYIVKIKLPDNYTIKNKKDNYNIPVDNYSLLDLPKALKCVCNDEVMVSIYNQNMIVIWKNVKN